MSSDGARASASRPPRARVVVGADLESFPEELKTAPSNEKRVRPGVQLVGGPGRVPPVAPRPPLPPDRQCWRPFPWTAAALPVPVWPPHAATSKAAAAAPALLSANWERLQELEKQEQEKGADDAGDESKRPREKKGDEEEEGDEDGAWHACSCVCAHDRAAPDSGAVPVGSPGVT